MILLNRKPHTPQTPEEMEAYRVKTYKELITPGIISFRKSPEYYLLGNTYRCVWAIRSYAETVQKDSADIAVLHELGEMDGVTLHMYTRHLPDIERNDIFNRAQNRTTMQKNNAWKLHEQIQADEQMSVLSRVIRETQRTKERFVYCAVFIELIANDLKQLVSKQMEVRSFLSRHKILVDKLHLRQLKAYNTIKPNGKNCFGTEFERVYPSSSVANLYPFSYSGKADPHGFYIGARRIRQPAIS